MIMMWPCKTCKNYSTSPEGCLLHAPVRPEQTFEEELIEAMTRPVDPSDDYYEGAVMVSGMTFVRPLTPPENLGTL